MQGFCEGERYFLKNKLTKTKSKFANNSFFNLNMFQDQLPKETEEDDQDIIGLTKKPKNKRIKKLISDSKF